MCLLGIMDWVWDLCFYVWMIKLKSGVSLLTFQSLNIPSMWLLFM